MRPETVAFVEAWWAALFGVPRDDLWRGVHVARHAKLDDYPGTFVAWQGSGVHVSVPSTVNDADVESLAAQGLSTLADDGFWRVWAGDRGLSVIGPSVHAYLDEDPGDDGSVPRIDPALLGQLRASVPPNEWEEAGFEDDPGHVFGCYADGRLVAASILRDFADAPRDIGLLVAPDLRARGLGHRVGGAATSYAVRHHGFAVWRAHVRNQASLATSRELGFERYAGQLAVRAAR